MHEKIHFRGMRTFNLRHLAFKDSLFQYLINKCQMIRTKRSKGNSTIKNPPEFPSFDILSFHPYCYQRDVLPLLTAISNECIRSDCK